MKPTGKAKERRLLLRRRIALTTGLIVATAILAVSAIAWLVTDDNLRGEVDQALLTRLPQPGRRGQLPKFDGLCTNPDSQPLQRFTEGVELFNPDGSVCAPSSLDKVVKLPADGAVTAPALRDGVTVSGVKVRVLLYPIGNGRVVAVSRPLTDIDNALNQLRNALIVTALLSVALAGTVALLLTRAALVPVERLTETVEHIARTEDLETPVDVTGRDEAGRLGRAFTAMTAALSDSRRRQRDLVADAAHELRTPLTSLRTNVELLARSEQRGRPLPDGHRAKIMASLQSQTVEFSALVEELVMLARDERELSRVEVDVDDVLARAVRRAGSRAGGHRFDVEVAPWQVIGDPPSLERLALNLLDNAVKFSPSGSTIEVRSAPGWLTIRDQGPGIPAEHREHVFDRFWRSPEARGMPGSGLGLAIVANTVTAHGGTVEIVEPPDGRGCCVRVELPVRPAARDGQEIG
ncbi:sensor histidine kinase [Amycolatopsis taiwanensis]|uniref:sensor histidine kinase n=1 Tax=Amycolatopsis taiwanensis TaxID=342230 RepID=UPI0004B21CC3|nr:HAMP domain-containing sensor histidine kinase [Amycolatopsis taiwanensis]